MKRSTANQRRTSTPARRDSAVKRSVLSFGAQKQNCTPFQDLSIVPSQNCCIFALPAWFCFFFWKNFVRQKTTKNVGLFQFQFQFSRPITRLAQQSLLLCPLGVRIDKRSRQVKQGEISAGGRRLHFFSKNKITSSSSPFFKINSGKKKRN